MKLVSPMLCIYTVESKASLEALIERLGIDSHLAGNLKQVCGYDIAPRGKSAIGKAQGWVLLQNVKWLRREGCPTVHPACGTAAQMQQQVPQLSELSDDQLRQLFSKRASAGKWKRVAQPFFVDELADGSCLKERRAEQITIAPAVTSPAVNSIFPNLLSDHVTLSHV